MSNVVWILGSGFSKPLGGPTLDELFTVRALRQLESICRGEGRMAHLAQKLTQGDAALVRRMFLIGSGRREEPQAEPNDIHLRDAWRGQWGDAEEFLDAIETGARYPDSVLAAMVDSFARRLHRSTEGRQPGALLKDLQAAARRLLAVECSTFLLSADPKSERWHPYRRWVETLQNRGLGHTHTIVTFNYDTVLETLGLKDWVQLPGGDPPPGSSVLKLHGSVDWKRSGSGFERTEEHFFAATCADAELAIAPPGPSKSDIADEFQALWQRARQSITSAQVVFFVGYRFPPTDSIARERILRAVGSHAKLNIVLGPNEQSPDVARLRAMLQFQSPNKKAVVHPMWAQDFFSVFPSGLLTPI